MEKEADICIVAEGSYPYYSGGVSQWAHELITAHPEFTFHVITLVPPRHELKFLFKFPENVIGHTVYVVQHLPEGSMASKAPKEIWDVLHSTLTHLITSADYDDFEPIIALFEKYRKVLGKKILCESQEAWDLFLKIYRESAHSAPFKSYFATIYTICRSLSSLLLPELPKAKLYHALCTGYAGFLLCRAKKELGVPCIVTEQGIYSNERRIEIFMADWIPVMESLDLALEEKEKTLKDFWLNTFLSLAKACYKSCDEVISTFDGNHSLQIEGGADPKKITTIVHGTDFKEYAGLRKKRPLPRTVAFVGRIVPIKDVKTFIRACKLVKEAVPDVRLIAAGSTTEDSDYFIECEELAKNLGLGASLQFLGHIDFKKFLADLDLLVLTSISEAQPLVILEAGAAGIPAVATDVGGCRQLLYGSIDESPPLGQGGIITPILNHEATAKAIIRMLTDQKFYDSCCETMAARIEKYYVFEQEQKSYTDIYNGYIKRVAWQG